MGKFDGIPLANRRAFIGRWALGAALASMGTSWRGSAIAEPVRFTTDPFTMGVACGDPTPDGFVLWTRIAPYPLDFEYKIDGLVEVVAEVAEDQAFRRIVRRQTVFARPDRDHCVHAEIIGLPPGRPYFYRFRVGGVVSPVGKAATAPNYGASLDHLRFAWHSCSHYEQGYFTAYGDLAAQNPDVILSLGDYIYEVSYGPAVRRMPVDDAFRLEDYRAIHAMTKMDKDLQAAHAVAPWLYIWDDHEVANDYQGDIGKVMDGQSDEMFAQRKLNAYRAFFEYQPLRARARFDATDHMRIYGEVGYGDLVAFTLLDTRQYRSEAPCPEPGRHEAQMVTRANCPALTDTSRTILGPRQERFVRERFMADPFRWAVMAQPTLFATLIQTDRNGAPAVYTDGWSAFEPARQRLIEQMRRRKSDVSAVVIGGDMHAFWAADVKMDYQNPESESVAVEFVGGSITSKSYNYERFTRMLPQNPHIKFFDDRTQGYGLVDVTRQSMRVALRHTPDTWRRDAGFSDLAVYDIAWGDPHLHQRQA